MRCGVLLLLLLLLLLPLQLSAVSGCFVRRLQLLEEFNMLMPAMQRSDAVAGYFRCGHHQQQCGNTFLVYAASALASKHALLGASQLRGCS